MKSENNRNRTKGNNISQQKELTWLAVLPFIWHVELLTLGKV